jgi:dihydroorotate dehydrogenase/Pyruvate/2-oxoacid:ferredoxin oxidoreductase delta subunit
MDLSVEIAGVRWKTPVFLSAGPCSTKLENLKKAVANRIGAVDTKCGRTSALGEPVPEKFYKLKSPRHALYVPEAGICFWMNATAYDEHLTLDEACKLISRAKKELNVPVFGNFLGFSTDPDEWIKVGLKLQDAGADALINYFFPLLFKEDPTGGNYLNLVDKILRPLAQELSIPVYHKLSPGGFVQIAGDFAVALEKAGVSAMIASDAAILLPPLNIEDGGKPLYAGMKEHAPALASGPFLRYFVYKIIYDATEKSRIPVIGVGGITDAQSAIEAILYGASAVGINTALVLNGWDALKNMVNGIEDYMRKHEYSSIEDFRGLAKKHLKDSYKKVAYPDCFAVVDSSLCNGCGKCLLPASCEAMSVEAKKAKVDTNLCKGCGLCVYLCPKKAIKIGKVKNQNLQ